MYKTVFKIFRNPYYFISDNIFGDDESTTISDNIIKQSSIFDNEISQILGIGVGLNGIQDGIEDAVKSYIKGNKVCCAISVVGICADAIQVVASTTPAAKTTLIITLPISTGCKSFVWYCNSPGNIVGGC